MPTHDLRSFLAQLEHTGDLRRIAEPVSPHLEMTALADRVLRAGGPALLFENPTGHTMPVLANLFGTPERVARAMGWTALPGCAPLANCWPRSRSPRHPRASRKWWAWAACSKRCGTWRPRAQQPTLPGTGVEGQDVDLARLPIQHCWPGDVAPLVTWGLVITRGPHKTRQNLGIYRQQVLGRNQLIMRWLAHRGGRSILPSTAACTPASLTRWPSPLAPTWRPSWAP